MQLNAREISFKELKDAAEKNGEILVCLEGGDKITLGKKYDTDFTNEKDNKIIANDGANQYWIIPERVIYYQTNRGA